MQVRRLAGGFGEHDFAEDDVGARETPLRQGIPELAGIAGAEIILTWFGVGIQPPRPSFGALIFDAQSVRTLNANPHLLLFPGAVVTILFFSFNLLGDALTDAFTPKAR